MVVGSGCVVVVGAIVVVVVSGTVVDVVLAGAVVTNSVVSAEVSTVVSGASALELLHCATSTTMPSPANVRTSSGNPRGTT